MYTCADLWFGKGEIFWHMALQYGLLIAGALVAYFVGRKLHQRAQDGRNQEVMAKVVDVKEKKLENGFGLVTNVYEYKWNGKVYQTDSKITTTEKKYKIGEIVNIVINPDKPESITEPGYEGNSKLFAYVGGAVIGFIFIGIVLNLEAAFCR